jgi:hypothetical protein
MARKRGGLAGIWDRNKKILKPIATIAGGLIGGPWGAGAVGGLIGGFDRPGKGGIGFDFKEGIKGGIKGYAMGKLGEAFGVGARGASGAGLNSVAGGFRNVGLAARDAAAPFLNTGRRVAGWAGKDPKNLLALGQTAIGGLNAYGMAQQNNALNAETRLQQDRERQRNRMREMLLPYFTQHLQSMSGGR